MSSQRPRLLVLFMLTLGLSLHACTSDPEGPVADEFVLPLEKISLDGQLTARLIAASPSPPAKGSNRWTIALSDESGEPVSTEGLNIRLRMPKHGHGAPIPTITDGEYEGEFSTRLSFSMGGVWEVRLYRDGTSADQDAVFLIDVAD